MAELVARTSAAVAVGDALTTLIDWVSIETLSGFTIVVANAGGGSASDIADVQIDTSTDGGATSSLDQHAGVPAVPIAAGKAAEGTFTETAAFVRVRALCAEGEDTTATAHLLADSAAARICTLADVKDRLVIEGTDYDVMLARIIAGVEAIFSEYCRRPLIAPAADVTEYYTGHGSHLSLARYPVISIASICESYLYDFASATALIADTDYRLVNAGYTGILWRCYGEWANVPGSVRVVYRGGYCSAGQSPGEGEYPLPSDLREAAIEQSSFIYKRKDDLGLSAVGFQGGSMSKFSAIDLLPMVKKVLDTKRRPSL